MLKKILTIFSILAITFPIQGAAPYVDSKTTKEQFDSITDKDMDILRGKKILFASRSFGLNLTKGLKHLAKIDKKYSFLESYKRFDVFKAGGDLQTIPSNIYQNTNFVHFMASYWPHDKRIGEVEKLLKDKPHEFGQQTDVVIIYYHTAMENIFDTYAAKMDAMQKSYPHIKFIYVCAGYMAPSQNKSNKQAEKFNAKVRARYKGKVPLYDLGAILSDDGRSGINYCPEYSKDPAGVHPNLPAGESMMAKGFLLILREAFKHKSDISTLSKKVASDTTETLNPSHLEYKAVRAILDTNGLSKKQVNSVAVIEKGHVVELYLQEGGIKTISKEIGTLKRLRKLHLYGDRNLDLPLITSISPSIGKCTQLEEVLLNHNNLRTLPKEMVNLKKIKKLSIADNKLTDLPAVVMKWIKQHDPQGLKAQNLK